MQETTKKQIPIRQGRFIIPEVPGAKPFLIGARCKDCGAVFSHPRVICLNCGKQHVEPTSLSGKGKVYSYTVVWQPLPNSVVKVPYAIVIVSLQEGCQITGVVTEDFRSLKVGKNVEVYFEKVKEDQDGNSLMIDKFRVVN